jgi:hypothetical protein
MRIATLLALLLSFPASAAPLGPLTVESSVPRTVGADRWVDAEFTVRAAKDVEGVTAFVRGLDGIVVEPGPRVDLGPLAAGEEGKLRARVKAPAGRAGYVVVDVTWARAGKTGARSVPFATGTAGARKPHAKGGTIVRDEDGRIYETSPAERR